MKGGNKAVPDKKKSWKIISVTNTNFEELNALANQLKAYMKYYTLRSFSQSLMGRLLFPLLEVEPITAQLKGRVSPSRVWPAGAQTTRTPWFR